MIWSSGHDEKKESKNDSELIESNLEKKVGSAGIEPAIFAM